MTIDQMSSGQRSSAATVPVSCTLLAAVCDRMCALKDGRERERSIWNLDEMLAELQGFLHYAGPPAISYAFDAAVEIIALAYVAKIGERELAAAGLAFMLSNMTGHAVYTGMSTALSTTGSQAYGAQKYHLVGTVMQQSIIVVGAALVPIGAMWLFAGTIFHSSGIVPEIADMAGTIIRLQIMTLPPMALMQLLKVWLECQGIMRPITGASVVVCVFAGIFCHLLIGMDLCGLGVHGAPIAILAAYTLGDVALLAEILREGYHLQTWHGFSQSVWVGIGPFAALACVGAGMVCLEWWSWEILGVVGSAFGETATAVQTVLVNASYFLYAAGEGVAVSAGTRVGNALGAGNALAAQRSAALAVMLAFASSILIILPLVGSRGHWASAFLTEPASAELVESCTPALIAFLVLNGCYGALSGILLGSGKQKIAVAANFVACYLVGVPMGLLLSFYFEEGIRGLWWGQCAGVALLCCVLCVYLVEVNWNDLAHSARAAAAASEAGFEHIAVASSTFGTVAALPLKSEHFWGRKEKLPYNSIRISGLV
jgi:MATE family multidrug resistance protein